MESVRTRNIDRRYDGTGMVVEGKETHRGTNQKRVGNGLVYRVKRVLLRTQLYNSTRT